DRTPDVDGLWCAVSPDQPDDPEQPLSNCRPVNRLNRIDEHGINRTAEF
ncbi:MAG: hypothetical protein QOE88_2697, partial [Verrucomicrobiota bacterium]|nr:hypothetical protein [Verrucomicrobiota bacterium]